MCVYVCVYVCVCSCIYIYIYMGVCVCVCVCVKLVIVEGNQKAPFTIATTLHNSQHYNVRIKGNVEQSRERMW